MTLTIGLAALAMLGFAALVLIGVATIHVGMRWWLMLMCGLDWDDAGALIRAKYRRRHGVHQAGALPQPVPGPVPGPVPMAERLARAAELGQQPVRQPDATLIMPRVHVSGQPPWAGDDTHELPRVRPDARP